MGTNATETRTVVAAYGDSDQQVVESIESANSANRTARYVTVHISDGYVFTFSPYAQVLRTQRLLVVRAMAHVYGWKLKRTSIVYSGYDQGVAPVEVPLIVAPDLDAVSGLGKRDALRRAGIPCPDCDLYMAAIAGPTPDPWSGLHDPWQIHPDYTYWHSGT